jgi:hypothetical protein
MQTTSQRVSPLDLYIELGEYKKEIELIESAKNLSDFNLQSYLINSIQGAKDAYTTFAAYDQAWLKSFKTEMSSQFEEFRTLYDALETQDSAEITKILQLSLVISSLLKNPSTKAQIIDLIEEHQILETSEGEIKLKTAISNRGGGMYEIYGMGMGSSAPKEYNLKMKLFLTPLNKVEALERDLVQVLKDLKIEYVENENNKALTFKGNNCTVKYDNQTQELNATIGTHGIKIENGKVNIDGNLIELINFNPGQKKLLERNRGYKGNNISLIDFPPGAGKTRYIKARHDLGAIDNTIGKALIICANKDLADAMAKDVGGIYFNSKSEALIDKVLVSTLTENQIKNIECIINGTDRIDYNPNNLSSSISNWVDAQNQDSKKRWIETLTSLKLERSDIPEYFFQRGTSDEIRDEYVINIKKSYDEIKKKIEEEKAKGVTSEVLQARFANDLVREGNRNKIPTFDIDSILLYLKSNAEILQKMNANTLDEKAKKEMIKLGQIAFGELHIDEIQLIENSKLEAVVLEMKKFQELYIEKAKKYNLQNAPLEVSININGYSGTPEKKEEGIEYSIGQFLSDKIKTQTKIEDISAVEDDTRFPLAINGINFQVRVDKLKNYELIGGGFISARHNKNIKMQGSNLENANKITANLLVGQSSPANFPLAQVKSGKVEQIENILDYIVSSGQSLTIATEPESEVMHQVFHNLKNSENIRDFIETATIKTGAEEELSVREYAQKVTEKKVVKSLNALFGLTNVEIDNLSPDARKKYVTDGKFNKKYLKDLVAILPQSEQSNKRHVNFAREDYNTSLARLMKNYVEGGIDDESLKVQIHELANKYTHANIPQNEEEFADNKVRECVKTRNNLLFFQFLNECGAIPENKLNIAKSNPDFFRRGINIQSLFQREEIITLPEDAKLDSILKDIEALDEDHKNLLKWAIEELKAG